MLTKKKPVKLLDSDSEAEGHNGFRLNADYAQRYDKWRGSEEMQKFKARYGDKATLDEVNESSESESTSEEEWTPEDDKSFLAALSSLKSKNPKIYDGSKQFFSASTSAAAKGKEMHGKEKPFLMKDHERKMILEEKMDLEEDNEDRPRSLSYYEHQDQIKQELKSVLTEFDSEIEDNSDLLKKRIRTKVEVERDEDDYRKWLKGELTKLDDGGAKEEELKFLRDYWNDPKLDDGEQFLRDYVLERKYLEEDEENKDYIPTYDEIVHDSDEGGISGDEQRLEEMEKFENKFNFRFEEPDPEFIKKYPRTIEESYRRIESKRKQDRIKAKERKQEEKDRKVAEIQQLKALKRNEILAKLDKLHKIAGEGVELFEDADLDGEFNPEEYDRRMQKIFSQDYYQDADQSKPVFEYDEAIDGEQEDLDIWVPSEESDNEEPNIKGNNPRNKIQDNPLSSSIKSSTSIKVFDTKAELMELSKGKRMSKKKSVFLEALEKKKPKFDPKVHQSFEKYFDEYYKLDFEDLVGDLPCRFKYRSVVPNDFGLSTEEVLNAEDSELNQWASLKKTYQYRLTEEEKYDVQAFSKKALNSKKKKQVLASLFSQGSKDDEEESGAEEASVIEVQVTSAAEKKKKKKKKKNLGNVSVPEVAPEPNPSQHDETKSKRKKKKKKQSNGEGGSTSKTTMEVEQEAVSKSTGTELNKMKRQSTATVPQVTTPSIPEIGLSKRKRKNRKRKSLLSFDTLNINITLQSGVVEASAKEKAKTLTVHASGSEPNRKEKKAKSLKRKIPEVLTKQKTALEGVSDDRLRAYGINPTKYEKKRKYAK